MATTRKKTTAKIRPVKRSTPQQRMAMKRSFLMWKRSAAGRKYERMKANPAAYKRHLMERITKIRDWIARLRTSKDPLTSNPASCYDDLTTKTDHPSIDLRCAILLVAQRLFVLY